MMSEEKNNQKQEDSSGNKLNVALYGQDHLKITAKDEDGNETEVVNTKG